MPTRREKILAHIDPTNSKGIELGPLCWPVVTKQEGKIWYADHATTEELQRLYKDDPGVPSGQIVPVDFALQGRSLYESVGRQRFDYAIASHVIEHVPDVIAWLQDIASILRPGGVLSLIIPDKRFTFDIDRNVSRPADIIGAHLDGRTRPDSATLFDFAASYRDGVTANDVWNGQLHLSTKTAKHRYTAKQALEMCAQNSRGEYVDTHVTVYTPASFFAVVRELIPLGLFDFSVASFADTAPGEYEFFVTLRKADKQADRKTLLRSVPKVPAAQPIRALEQQVATLTKRLEEETARHAQEMQALLTSRSWRITKPLRLASRTAGRGKRPPAA